MYCTNCGRYFQWNVLSSDLSHVIFFQTMLTKKMCCKMYDMYLSCFHSLCIIIIQVSSAACADLSLASYSVWLTKLIGWWVGNAICNYPDKRCHCLACSLQNQYLQHWVSMNGFINLSWNWEHSLETRENCVGYTPFSSKYSKYAFNCYTL